MHRYRTVAVVTIMFFGMLVPVAGAQENFVHPRIVSVTGTAEIKVPPDEVQLTLGIDSHDKDLAVAKASNDQRTKKLMALAHTAGLEAKNIQTSALTMGPEYTEDEPNALQEVSPRQYLSLCRPHEGGQVQTVHRVVPADG
jgi:uncharacterized protein YggE